MNSKSNVSIVFNVLLVFFVSVLLVNYFKASLNSEHFLTFSSYLEFLSNAPTVDFTAVKVFNSITSNWGLFNFFRDFLNTLGAFSNVIFFVCANIINVLVMTFYVITGLFVA